MALRHNMYLILGSFLGAFRAPVPMAFPSTFSAYFLRNDSPAEPCRTDSYRANVHTSNSSTVTATTTETNMAPKTAIDRALERERRKEERRQARREKKQQPSVSGDTAAVSPTVSDKAAQSPTFQGVDELAEMDDWGSAWHDAKEKGEGWGGRGKGGRGIQRNTWQPKDVFVEGERGMRQVYHQINVDRVITNSSAIRRWPSWRSGRSRSGSGGSSSSSSVGGDVECDDGRGGKSSRAWAWASTRIMKRKSARLEQQSSGSMSYYYCDGEDCDQCVDDLASPPLPRWAVDVARFGDWLCDVQLTNGDMTTGEDAWFVLAVMPVVAMLLALVSCVDCFLTRRQSLLS